MTVGVYMARMGHELGIYTPSRNRELGDHPGVVWARTFRVVWRRINRMEEP